MKRSCRLASFVSAFLALSSARPAAQGPTHLAPAPEPPPLVFVDDDFGPGTHGWQFSRFDALQDGVDAVAVGGTVVVRPGLYLEDVVIDKRLVLLGQGEHAARVQGAGSGSVFTVRADGVTIRNLHISHPSARALTLWSSANTFRDNLANGEVRLEDEAHDNVLADNRIGALSAGSYHGSGPHGNRIEGNSSGAIVLAHASGTAILGNTITSTSRGITLNLCDDNEIAGNTIEFRFAGIELTGSHRNTIASNSLSGDVYYGVRIASSNSCSVTDNTITGLVRLTGIDLVYAEDAHVADNRLQQEARGISLYQCLRASVLDNSMDLGGLDFSSYVEGRQYYDSHRIAGNTLRGRPIHYFVHVDDLVVPRDAGQVILVGCERATIRGLALTGAWAGIQLAYCADGVIAENKLTASGIRAWWSDALTIRGNLLRDCDQAIDVGGTHHLLASNVIVASSLGIRLGASDSTLRGNEIRSCEFALWFAEAIGVGTVPRIPTGNVLTGNVLHGNAFGIHVQGSANVLQGNRIEATREAGVGFVDRDDDTLDAVRNTLAGNSIVGNGVGVRIERETTENTITENTIAGNGIGVQAPEASTGGNHIHHNDLVNLENAFDAGTNAWDDGYPSGGNYWHDYNGIDQDGDGLGDTPRSIPGRGNQDAHPRMHLSGPGALWADVATLSAANGANVTFRLHAGPGHAGRPYLLLGSLAGTEPGTPLPGGALLPLVPDWFTRLILANPDSPTFTGFQGVLDATGSASATWHVPPFERALVGPRFDFAYALGAPWDFVSWPITLDVVE